MSHVAILVDTGVLVSLYDAADRYHNQVSVVSSGDSFAGETLCSIGVGISAL